MGIVTGTVHVGEFDWIGSFTSLDLLAAAEHAAGDGVERQRRADERDGEELRGHEAERQHPDDDADGVW